MEVGIYWYQNMYFIGSKNGLVGCVFTLDMIFVLYDYTGMDLD